MADVISWKMTHQVSNMTDVAMSPQRLVNGGELMKLEHTGVEQCLSTNMCLNKCDLAKDRL